LTFYINCSIIFIENEGGDCMDQYLYKEQVEESYRYFAYPSEDDVEWYFCEQNEIEVECYED